MQPERLRFSDAKSKGVHVTVTSIDGASYVNGDPFIMSVTRDISQVDRSQQISTCHVSGIWEATESMERIRRIQNEGDPEYEESWRR
jgi:hypothetical protein